MERTLISEIFADPKSFDKVQVTVGGWIRTMRAQKTFGFIELNDGSYFKSLQVVFEDGIVENYKDIAKQNDCGRHAGVYLRRQAAHRA